MAVVEGEMISLLDVKEAQRLWRKGFFKHSILKELFTNKQFQKQPQALDYLIYQALLDITAQEMKLKVPSAQLQQELNQRRKSRRLSKKAFSSLLVRNGFTSASYKDFIKKSLLRKMVVQRKILEKIRISDHDLNEYATRTQKKALFSSYQYELGALFFPPTKKGEKQAYKAYQMFKTNVSQFDSYQPSIKSVKRKHIAKQTLKALHPLIRNAVKTLSVGQYGRPLFIPGVGYHIFKVLWKTPIIQNKKRQKKLYEQLYKQLFKQELKAWLERRKTKVFVRISV